MRIYQLCTYHFTTEAAAAEYLPRWELHIASLEMFAIQTHGFFSAPSDPRTVIALISYAGDADPDAIMRNYMVSPEFKEDMRGYDISQMEAADKLILTPGNGSPLG